MSWELERESMRGLLQDLNAEIERLRLELKQANAYLNDAMQKIDNLHIHIVRQDAEIERLKKALDQAIKIGRVGFRGYYGEGAKWMYDYDKLENDACGITSYKCADHPELAAWLKEKNG